VAHIGRDVTTGFGEEILLSEATVAQVLDLVTTGSGEELPTIALMLVPEARAQCVGSARWDLRGGRPDPMC